MGGIFSRLEAGWTAGPADSLLVQVILDPISPAKGFIVMGQEPMQRVLDAMGK